MEIQHIYYNTEHHYYYEEFQTENKSIKIRLTKI